MQIRTAQFAKAIAPAVMSVVLLMATAPVSVYAQGNTGGRPAGPDMAAVAEKLGVTADDLKAALGGPPPDFAAAAAKLGISEQTLKDAMGGPPPR